jgi:hypothetical protein
VAPLTDLNEQRGPVVANFFQYSVNLIEFAPKGFLTKLWENKVPSKISNTQLNGLSNLFD